MQGQSTTGYGLCECGCGAHTNIFKGEPRRFIVGHHQRASRPEDTPTGICECGCGQRTPIATHTSRARGAYKGLPLRFAPSHSGRYPRPAYTGDGLCECGCGEKAPLSTVTRAAQGLYEGQPRRFINGHAPRRRGPEYTIEDRGYTTPCWIWIGAKIDGYGRKGRSQAHRVYYERAKGSIPEGLQIDHLCVVPSCVNPDHLEPVTGAENVRRGRHTKLSIAQAKEIKALKGSITAKALAPRYGVSAKSIGSIWRGRTWRDV